MTVSTDSPFPDATTTGLIQGALLGPGLRIDVHDPHLVAASAQLTVTGAPDYLEIRKTRERPTQLRFDLWCGTLRRRCGLRAISLGAVIATALALLSGWLVVISVPCAMLIAIGFEQLTWRRARRDLRQRIETYYHNLRMTGRMPSPDPGPSSAPFPRSEKKPVR